MRKWLKFERSGRTEILQVDKHAIALQTGVQVPRRIWTLVVLHVCTSTTSVHKHAHCSMYHSLTSLVRHCAHRALHVCTSRTSVNKHAHCSIYNTLTSLVRHCTRRALHAAHASQALGHGLTCALLVRNTSCKRDQQAPLRSMNVDVYPVISSSVAVKDNT